MRIGELSRQAGVSDKTLRYYEDVGVLPPARRTSGGYRDYDPSALDRLAFIRAAQAVGLSLGEIREIIGFRDRGETPCAHVAELVRQRAAELEQRIAELERMRTELRRLARRARSLNPADCEPDMVCHVIAAR
jgi:MerR family copper efflux transcriptional regulator